jgi:hypothetical protein
MLLNRDSRRKHTMAILYRVTNKLNTKKYYGITSGTLSKRKKTHLHSAKRGSSGVFHTAIRKYGKDNFVWETIREFPSIEEAGKAETEIIIEENTVCPNGYNMTSETRFNPLGLKRSEETKQKLSDANRGKTKSEETRKSISDSLKGHVPWNKGKTGVQTAWNKGISHSEKTKSKIGNSNKGKTPWNKGIPRSDETKEKIRLTKSKSKFKE